MARLSVRLLGLIQVTLDREPVTGFESDKVRALLAYLAAEANRPHRREALAGLLWPEWPERSARTNLRRALANLRQVIGDHQATPPFLLITRQTIRFNNASDAWVDVTAFSELLMAGGAPGQAIRQLKEAVDLYRGGFLEGFSVDDSAAFEEWALLKRERLGRQVVAALHRLAGYYEQNGALERALPHAWRQVELEPWQEEAHRQLMRLLVFSGQRNAALTQYETLRRLLAEDLDVEPEKETTRLYEQVRDGKLETPPSPPARLLEYPAQPPAFLDEKEKQPEVERPVFVARQRELEKLEKFLDKALAGKGQVVFVTGEAGSGKTALVGEFARRAQDAHPDPSTLPSVAEPALNGVKGQALLAASGNCNAYTGVGDPYLPLREVLGLLTGDVEAMWSAGAISREHARRLWDTLPLTAQALVEDGPDLIDTFVSGTALVKRAATYAPSGAGWLTRLDELVERKTAVPGAATIQQSNLFEQYSRVLAALARQAPLLLVLDDLQWGDTGSISLLFHLGRQLRGSRILILGAYRPEEVASGRGEERHPLEAVVNEFQRNFGDIAVDLSQAEGREFVDAFLDSEPNRLGPHFRETLYRQTRGHPLFTIELLRGLQERGDLVQDEAGCWVAGPALDWETLSPRVEGVIAERIGRLPEALQEALTIASVEGEEFTAEVVARVSAADEGEMVRRLSGELDRKHRLVHARRIQRMDGQRLAHYRFRHYLFQKYLDNSLDEVERAYLHEAVGTALEGLYGEGADEVAVQLARHFREAGLAEKAVHYLHQAGNRAVRLSANEEAIAHFTQALGLLETLPDTPERARQELTLQIDLFAPLEAIKGYAAPEVGRVGVRARELCQQMEETPQLFPALWLLTSYYGVRAEYRTGLEIGEQLLNLAERVEDPQLTAMAHWSLGWQSLHVGELAQARAHLEQVIAFYDPQQHRSLAFLYGQDPGVSCLAWVAWTLWLLGYPDQALQRSQEALALAQDLDHPFTLGFTLAIAGAIFHLLRREGQAAQERAEALFLLSTEEGFLFLQAAGTILLGWGQTEEGRVEEGIAQMRQGLVAYRATGAALQWPHKLALLAEAYGKAGQAEEGLSVLAKALVTVEDSGERYYEAELYRLKGELLLTQGETEADTSATLSTRVEACYRQAIEVARQQGAKAWELRTTVSLSRLWQQQGKTTAAREMLAEIYGWFTEGFDTVDLKEAQALLEELA